MWSEPLQIIYSPLSFNKAMELAEGIKSVECETRQLQAALSMSTTRQVDNRTAHKTKNKQKRGSLRPANQGNSVAYVTGVEDPI